MRTHGEQVGRMRKAFHAEAGLRANGRESSQGFPDSPALTELVSRVAHKMGANSREMVDGSLREAFGIESV